MVSYGYWPWDDGDGARYEGVVLHILWTKHSRLDISTYDMHIHIRIYIYCMYVYIYTYIFRYTVH